MKKLICLILAVTILSTCTLTASAKSSLSGDANLDGKLTISDARTVLLYISEASYNTPDFDIDNGDANGDGRISVADARLILLRIANGENTVSAERCFTDFTLDIFKASVNENENTVVNPISAATITAMLADGANGKAVEELESVLGDVGDIKEYLKSYNSSLSGIDTLKTSTAIWGKSGYPFKQSYFDGISANYNAELNTNATFDETTLNEIEQWVFDNTCGMIDSNLSSFSKDTTLVLANTSWFECGFKYAFDVNLTVGGKFTASDGSVQDVEMMYSPMESASITSDASYFIKQYKDERFSFIAVLPNGELEDYIASLDAEKLTEILNPSMVTTAKIIMPKFECSYKTNLSDILKDLGAESAFAYPADFSNISDNDLYIELLEQQSKITVDEQGTYGASATIGVVASGAVDRTITFDRPFMYIIADTQTNVPVYIGTVSNLK